MLRNAWRGRAAGVPTTIRQFPSVLGAPGDCPHVWDAPKDVMRWLRHPRQQRLLPHRARGGLDLLIAQAPKNLHLECVGRHPIAVNLHRVGRAPGGSDGLEQALNRLLLCRLPRDRLKGDLRCFPPPARYSARTASSQFPGSYDWPVVWFVPPSLFRTRYFKRAILAASIVSFSDLPTVPVALAIWSRALLAPAMRPLAVCLTTGVALKKNWRVLPSTLNNSACTRAMGSP